jgi:hypothetical protein
MSWLRTKIAPKAFKFGPGKLRSNFSTDLTVRKLTERGREREGWQPARSKQPEKSGRKQAFLCGMQLLCRGDGLPLPLHVRYW